MKKITWISALLLAVFIATGLFLASRKQLWTDELFTQANVEAFSFGQLIKGELNTNEGNPCPLYYLNQKLFFAAIHYKFPIPWKGEFAISEPRSQLIIRALNIIYVSLGLAIIFYVFAGLYSLKAGLLALLMMLSNTMVWSYWAEARPYGLWFLLSIIQCALLLHLTRPDDRFKPWAALTITHILLAMTIIFSFPQILLVSFLALKCRPSSWKKCTLLLALLPGAIIYLYYIQSKKTYPWLPVNPLGSIPGAIHAAGPILASYFRHWFSTPMVLNMPWAWLSVIGFYGLVMVLKPKKAMHPQAAVFAWSLVFLAFCSTIMIQMISLWKCNGNQDMVAARYFIFLSPFCLFALVLAFIHLKELARDPWDKRIVGTAWAGTFIITSLNTWMYILCSGFY